MRRTFVPGEPLTPTRPIWLDAAHPHSEPPTSRSEFLGTSPTCYALFRSQHEPELYCAVPQDWPAPSFCNPIGGRLPVRWTRLA
jgi:hypothetical protein